MERCTKARGDDVLSYIQEDAYCGEKISRASKRRMRDLLNDLIRMDQWLECVPAGEYSFDGAAGFEELRVLIESLNDRLTFYPIVAQIEFEPDSPEIARFSHVSGISSLPRVESRIAHQLFTLAEEREIHKIRPCRCGKLFFESRKDHDSCSAACRRKKLDGTEAHKQKRREYYRDHLKGGKGIVGKKQARSVVQRKKGGADAKAAK